MLRSISLCLMIAFSSLAVADDEILADAASEAGEVVIPGYSPDGSGPSTIIAHPNAPIKSFSMPEEGPLPAVKMNPHGVAPSTSPTTPSMPQQAPKQSPASSPPSGYSQLNIPDVKPASTQVVSIWNDYFNRLRACTPGTYALPQVNPVTLVHYGEVETNKIAGWENDKCKLTIMYYHENDPRLAHVAQQTLSQKILQYPTGLECSFSKQTIESLIAMNSIFLKGKQITLSDEDPISKAVAHECSPYVVLNGQKTMINPAEEGVAT